MPGPLHDPLLVLASFAVVGLLVMASRGLLGRAPGATFTIRKLLHFAVGAWTVAATALFHHVGWALVPPAVFLVVNATGRPRALAVRAAADPREARGLWLFPLGIVLLYVLFWDGANRGAVLAGAATLAVADPAAAAVGSRFGQRRFAPIGFGRTLEGSLTFLLLAGLASGSVAALVREPVLPLRIGVGCGVAGALIEILSPSGFDNLTVPIAVAATYTVLC